jgi:hypothetical protein
LLGFLRVFWGEEGGRKKGIKEGGIKIRIRIKIMGGEGDGLEKGPKGRKGPKGKARQVGEFEQEETEETEKERLCGSREISVDRTETLKIGH